MNSPIITSAFSALGLVTLASCGKAPDDKVVIYAISSTAHAQGGVCLNQDFAWMAGDVANGMASVTSIDKDTGIATVEVLAQTYQMAGRVVKKYNAEVPIEDITMKSPDDCVLFPHIR